VVHWSDRPQEVYEPGWLNLTHRNYLVRWVEWGALCDDHVLLYASKIANKQKPGWIHHLCVILFIVLNDADDLIEAPESREVKVGFIERCREWPKGPSYHRDVSVEIDRSSAICSTCSQCNHSGKSTSWAFLAKQLLINIVIRPSRSSCIKGADRQPGAQFIHFAMADSGYQSNLSLMRKFLDEFRSVLRQETPGPIPRLAFNYVRACLRWVLHHPSLYL